MIKHIPNLFTSLNLVTGCLGIYFTLTEEKFEVLYFVLIAAFFDAIDGLLARLLNAKSDFGGQLDSLADLISFGVLPSFYILMLLKEQSSVYWVAILITLFSAYRLAKFNIDDSQADSFLGLPTPANAVMITSLFLLPFELGVAFLMFTISVSCIALIAPIRLLALKFNNFDWSGNEPRWILIMGCILLLLIFKWSFVPFLIPFYAFVSLTFSFKSRPAE